MPFCLLAVCIAGNRGLPFDSSLAHAANVLSEIAHMATVYLSVCHIRIGIVSTHRTIVHILTSLFLHGSGTLNATESFVLLYRFGTC